MASRPATRPLSTRSLVSLGVRLEEEAVWRMAGGLCGGLYNKLTVTPAPNKSEPPEVKQTATDRVAKELATDRVAKELAGTDGWFKTGGELLFGVPMMAVAAAVLRALPLGTALVFIGTMVFVAVWGDVMHSSFHLYDDAVSHPESLPVHKRLVRSLWFRRYQHLHDIHHAYTNTNFGFFDFTIDKLFGTFCETRPPFLAVPPATSSLRCVCVCVCVCVYVCVCVCAFMVCVCCCLCPCDGEHRSSR
jgi:hypothetical protein